MFLIKGDDHHCWIKNINWLLNNKISQDYHKYICKRCLVHFHSKSKYERHI